MKVVLTREAGHNSEFAAWVPEDASLEEVPLTDDALLRGRQVPRVAARG